jgi:4a-hydroxytetrahydrobiopterin dehydratase
LERRLEFDNYEALRDFLDRAGELSEETGVYPNLSFGRTYVNMTLFADEDSGELTSDEAERFAERVDSLVIPPEVIPPDRGRMMSDEKAPAANTEAAASSPRLKPNQAPSQTTGNEARRGPTALPRLGRRPPGPRKRRRQRPSPPLRVAPAARTSA